MRKRKLISLLLSTLISISFSACGGSSGGSSASTASSDTGSDTITTIEPSFSLANEYTSGIVGKFIDSPVSGLNYSCDSKTKKTDSEGLFNCKATPIDFSLGNLSLGSIEKLTADYLIFPQDILDQPRSAALHPEVTKMAVLFQSLDNDGDSSNGIVIEENIVDQLNQEIIQDTGIHNISLEDLISIIEVIIENDPKNQLRLVTAQQAQDHLLSSISNTYESPIQP